MAGRKKTRRKATKKRTRRKTARRASPRRRPRSDRSVIRALLGIAIGVALGWMLVSWFRDDGDEPPTAINTTARGQTLVEIPTREQVASLDPDERDRIEQQVMAALANVPERVNEPAPGRAEMQVSARIRGADARHPASGRAELHALAGGRHVLRLTNLEVANGAELHVYLAEDPAIPGRHHVDLGPLKGNLGDQNYVVPAGIDPADYLAVVIYCEVFHRAYALAAFDTDRQ